VERIKPPRSLNGRMTYHSDYCDLHPYRRNGQDIPNPVQKMIINGQVVCPRCENEKNTQQLEDHYQELWEHLKATEKSRVLLKKSIVEDETLLEARFDTYLAVEKEETENKALMLQYLEQLKNGEVFNLILQGNQGAGKSHLAYSLLHELNTLPDKSCLFVSLDAMIRKIRDSFKNENSKYTEQYFNDLLSEVDFLVLDDLGAETGSMDTVKAATDFVQRVLYGITNTRQNKVTILTTNLSGEILNSMYDKKLVSRLFKNPRYVFFRVTEDKRKLPF
jgi:DNA replication protein DnaC